MAKQHKKEIYHPDDRFFKELMSDVASAKEFIENFCAAIAKDLDLDTLQPDNTSYINEQLKNFHSDIVYRCQFKDSDEGLYFSFLMEHKSNPDDGVVLQLGLYLFNFLHRLYNDKGRKLEPVLPIVFYNGKPDWTPKNVAELFETHPFFDKFEQYLPKFEFDFLNITKISLEQLLSLQIRFLREGLFSMANRHNADVILGRIELVLADQSPTGIRRLMTYIFGIIERSPNKVIKLFDQLDFTEKKTAMSVLEQIRKEGVEEGVEIGTKKVQIERKNALLIRIKSLFSLIHRFPDLSDEEVVVITLLDQEKVEQVRELLESKRTKNITKGLMELFFQDLPFEATDEKELEQMVSDYFSEH